MSIGYIVYIVAPSNLVMENPMAKGAGLDSKQRSLFIMRCNLIYSVAYGLVCWALVLFLLKMHFWSKTWKKRGAQCIQEAPLKPCYHKSDRHKKRFNIAPWYAAVC